jgi:hypothetical protein
MDDLELYRWVATRPEASLAILFGQASEFLIGGKTDPLVNQKPEHPDGLGGAVRGLAAGASGRLSEPLKESSSSTLSEAGADVGEELVPVTGRLNRVVSGTTLTGRPVDRTVETALLAAELVPLAALAAPRVGVLLQTAGVSRFGKAVTNGARSADNGAYLGMEFLDDGLPMVDEVADLTTRAVGAGASRGLPASANFAQTNYRATFSQAGRAELQRLTGLDIRTVDDLAAAITSGKVDPASIPVNVIVRDGNTLILNTRTTVALEQAGVPRSAFNVVDRTGDPYFEGLLTGQLERNNLTSAGVSTVTRQ